MQDTKDLSELMQEIEAAWRDETADRAARQARWDAAKGGGDEDDFDEDDFDSLADENGPSDDDIEEMEIQKAIDKAEKK